ncbi:MAG TPA: condensation domain-containing protein, partial [Kofleriaceae bacterium]|nr:condensation domain-containing protein [Kofleriaceae bacterium]
MNDIPLSQEQRAREFWDQQLQGELPVLELPFDRDRSGAARTVDSVRRRVPARALRRLADHHGVAIETVVLAAYCVLLQRYAGQDELVVGLASARGVLPIRVNLAERPAFRALVAEVGRLATGARGHADYPVAALLDELRGGRDPGHAPMFQAVFAAGGPDGGELAVAGAAFDLALGATAVDGELALALGYDARLFARGTIERIASAFAFLLEGIAGDPDRRVTDLPMLTPEERRRVVVEWNATAREFPRDRLLHDHVADHA